MSYLLTSQNEWNVITKPSIIYSKKRWRFTDMSLLTTNWKDYEVQYRNGTAWRAELFANMIKDTAALFENPHILDIGCGHGIDGCYELQTDVGLESGQFIGCEPDTQIEVNQSFNYVYPYTLEESTIPPNSIHVAYCTFVIEHISDPERFFKKIYDSLVKGGVFLGITDYAWSPFALISQMMEVTRLKNLYLDIVCGKRGKERYENYPTYYRANSPRQIKKFGGFSDSHFTYWHRYGELDHYLPPKLRFIGRAIDVFSVHSLLPRQIFIFALQK